MNQINTEKTVGIAFGPFEFYPLQRKLLRDGKPVRLGARALDLFHALVERPGVLVSKEDLIRRVWPDTHVEEVALRVHVNALRKILTQGRPEARDFINVPGRGYQFVAYTIPISNSPPVKSEESRSLKPGALPALRGRVIGRDRDIELVRGRVAIERCVTILGPGGIGKTTVALDVAHRFEVEFDWDVRFVDLSALSSRQGVANAIALALGVTEYQRMPIEDLENLFPKRGNLLFLDNCEHVAESVSEIVDRLLAKSHDLRIIATSREPLRLQREWLYRLPGLETPADVEDLSDNFGMSWPAVELFVERAEACSKEFSLDTTTAYYIACICGQLDGHALAIELAASRMDKFGVADIAGMLKDRFHALRRPRNAPLARHASLTAALDWSYDILSDQEKMVLRRISSFAGRFNLEDAVGACTETGVPTGAVVEVLANLVDKSFLSADLSEHAAFYRLYESMREYGRKKARDAGEYSVADQGHTKSSGFKT